jgi:multidrug efflux pump subunit AcrB
MISKFAKNSVVANLMMFGLLFLGVLCTFKMNRELFPQFSLDMINVTVVYPGASPQEVERTVIRKIEDSLIGLNNVKKVFSQSMEGFGSITLQLEEGSNLSNVKDEVTASIDRIITFPKEVERPIIKELVFEEVLLFLTIKGNLNPIAMKEFAEELKEEIDEIDGVSKTVIAGTRNYEIAIEVSQLNLLKYNITLEQISQKIRSESFDIPGGSIKTSNGEILIRGMNEKNIGVEFGKIIVATDTMGGQVLLKDIAVIHDQLDEDMVENLYFETPSVLLQIFRKSTSDAIASNQRILDFIEKRKTSLPSGVSVVPWFQNSIFIEERIDLLLNNGLQGFILVFLVLWAFMSFRLSFWVAMGIPTSFGGALVAMYLTGQTINMISLFALIMATGIVVDDAIVVGENIYSHFKQGKSRMKATIDGTLEVVWPVIGSVSTTIAAFIPMIMMTGVFGKFMQVIPYAMIAVLLTSLFECFFILPAHLAHSKEDGQLSKTRIWLNKKIQDFIDFKYLPFFKTAIKYRYVFFISSICCLILTVFTIKANLIKFNIFPDLDQFLIDISYELEEGAPYERTKEISEIVRLKALKLNEEFKNNMEVDKPIVEHVISFVGEQVGLNIKKGSHLGMTVIQIVPSEQRNIHSRDIVEHLRKFMGELPGVKKISFGKAFHQGPSGSKIEINLQGNSIDEIKIMADKVTSALSKIEFVIDINTDFVQGKNEIQYSLKNDARLSSIDFSFIGDQIRNNFYGNEVLRLTRHGEEVKVLTKLPQAERKSIGNLENSYYQNIKGEWIPFKELVQFKIEPSAAKISKVDGKISILINTDVEKKGNAKIILSEFEKSILIPLFKDSASVTYKLEGQDEQTKESFISLANGYFFVALPLIFFILAAIFSSYSQPIIIMFVIPFGVIGAALGHKIMGFDLSMFSMIGIVALSGIVVNDSLVLVEFINKSVREGVPISDALAQAGKNRFRAIVLTSLTTIAGLTPLLFETSLQAQVIIPMAISISFGLLVSTLLVLVFIPVLYYILEDIKQGIKLFFNFNSEKRN